MFVIPIVWSLPQALVCAANASAGKSNKLKLAAELSSTYPSNDGYILWFQLAFGDMAGFLVGAATWGTGLVDCAAFPVLALSYIESAVPTFFEHHVRARVAMCACACRCMTSQVWVKYILQVVVLVPIVAINMTGVEVLSKACAM